MGRFDWSRSNSTRKCLILVLKAATGVRSWRRVSIPPGGIGAKRGRYGRLTRKRTHAALPPAASVAHRGARFCVGAGAGLGARRLSPGTLGLGASPAEAAGTRLTAPGRREPDARTSAKAGSSRWSTPTGSPTDRCATRTPWTLASTTPAGSSWMSRTTGASSSAPVDNASTSSATGLPPGRARPGTASTSRCRNPWRASGSRSSLTACTDNSNVYLNGQLLGNHPYAYTGFSYDLTGLVHTDGVRRT